MARLIYHWRHVPVFSAEARARGLNAAVLSPEHAAAVSVAGVEDLWVLETIEKTWQAAYRIGVQDGSPIVAEVRLYPAEPDAVAGEWSGVWRGLAAPVPPGGLTARLLRKVKLGAHVTEGRHQLVRLERDARQRRKRSALRDMLRAKGLIRARPPSREPRRRRRGKRDLEHVATLYRAARQRGSHRPVADVAEQLGIKPKAASNAVYAARCRGLLGRTERGRAAS
jgi:hypothetical protein